MSFYRRRKGRTGKQQSLSNVSQPSSAGERRYTSIVGSPVGSWPLRGSQAWNGGFQTRSYLNEQLPKTIPGVGHHGLSNRALLQKSLAR